MSARKVMPPKAVKNQYMQVYVRCRPICENEVNQRNTSVIEVQGLKDICVQDRCNAKVTKTYSFDKVFNSNTGQADIYDTVVSPMISDVLSGFDCTVFAYGQTGSGKTFTMEGELCTGVSRDSKAGLIPRAMCALFDELLVLQSESSVRISFMELYNEELYDLLSPDEVPPKLRLFDDPTKKGSVVVQGLQEVMVHTLSQVMNELQKGSAKRQVAATIMNAQSSRSHTIFCVNVHFKENSVDGEELLRTGKLYLVDLAGSENIGRSGAVEKRVREAANINQSLLTLGRVTSCLVERQPHIPYRESKLTRLLQDSLGGKTKTSMIATISLAQSNVEETLSTLDYALRAKSVANKPEVNQKVSQVVILKEYMDVISNLKKKLEMSRNGSGVYVNYDNYRQMMDQKQELHQTRLDLISQMRAVAASKKSIEETCSDLKIKLVSENHNLQNVTNTIAQTSEEIHRASDNLEKASKKQGEADYLLKTLEHQEAQVRTQAEHLMSIADSVQEDSDKIHKRLDQSRFILEENKAALSKASLVKYHKMVLTKMQESVSVCKRLLMERGSALDSLTTEITKDGSNAINRVSSFEENLTSLLRHLQSILDKYQEDKENLGENISAKLSTFHSQFDRDLEQFERSLHDACMTFEQYLTHFPDLRDSLLDSVLTSIQSVQNTTKTELYKIKEDLNLIRMQWNNAVENTNKSMEHGISVDFKNLRPHIQEKCDELSDVGARLQKSLQGIVARRTETEQGREEKSMKVSKLQENIIADMTNAIERREESLPKYQAVYQTLLKNRELDSDRVLSIQDSVLEAVKKAKNLQSDTMTLCENVKSCDYKSTFDQVLQEYNSAQSQSRSQLQSAVNQSHVMMKTSGELCQNLSADFKDMRLKREHFVDVADNAHRIFLEGNENTSTVALNDLENQKALVNKILSSEISYDVPTGETPIKKIYGPISEKVCISSPIVKKVKPIIKKGTWRRLLRSPRRPLTSAKSFGDCEDDLMVSDSEVASIKRIRQTHSLQKASSLSDLRSSKVFQRPRVPKKNINFV